MICKTTKESIPEFLTGELDQKSITAVKEHISGCPACREELENLTAIWTKLGVLPEVEPDSNLRNRFYTMLTSYKEGLQQQKNTRSKDRSLSTIFGKLFSFKPLPQLVYSLTFLVLGLTAGYFIFSFHAANSELKDIRFEIQNLRQTTAISMLKQQSASDRLSGVSWSSQIKRPNQNTLQLLLNTLNNDSNVNVRLAVVNALYLFHEYPLIRQGLVHSLSRQDSPIVQSALIDLMVEIREHRAIKALKQLIKGADIVPEVKKHAELSLQQLINITKNPNKNKEIL